MSWRSHLLAAALLTVAAGQAQATVYVATWQGVVTSVEDRQGRLGPDPGALVGQTFTAVYRIDDETPGVVVRFGPGYSELGGLEGSPVSAVFAVGGRTWRVGETTGTVYAQDESYAGYDALTTYANTDTDQRHCEGEDEARVCIREQLERGLQLTLGAYDLDFTNGDFRTPFELTFDDTAASGFFSEGFRRSVDGVGSSYQIDIGLRPRSLSFAVAADLPVATVPEPASWALMIFGFGAAGAAIRTRRRDRLAA